MTLIERADAIANRVGLGENLISHRPRHHRWTSLAALLALISGASISLAGIQGTVRLLPLGYLLLLFALCSGAFLQIFGPLRRATRDLPLDEREMLLRLRSRHSAALTVAGMAMAGSWAIAVAVILRWPIVFEPGFWIIVAFTLPGLFSIIPALHASWTTRSPDQDEEK